MCIASTFLDSRFQLEKEFFCTVLLEEEKAHYLACLGVSRYHNKVPSACSGPNSHNFLIHNEIDFVPITWLFVIPCGT